MRIFSKLVLIINICFLVEVFFYIGKFYLTDGDLPQPLDIVRGSIVVLGELAIIINLLFLLIVFIRRALKVKDTVSTFILVLNGLFFIGQVYFYFFHHDTPHS